MHCKFSNFICQIYLNSFLAIETLWFYFFGNLFKKFKFDVQQIEIKKKLRIFLNPFFKKMSHLPWAYNKD
jgi:hypothetical protein